MFRRWYAAPSCASQKTRAVNSGYVKLMELVLVVLKNWDLLPRRQRQNRPRIIISIEIRMALTMASPRGPDYGHQNS